MWDERWSKISEVYPDGELDAAYQAALAAFITCLHAIQVGLHNSVAQSYH